MAQTTLQKKMDVINLYIKGLPKEEISAGANVSPDDVDAILDEFLEAAKRFFDLEQQTGKTHAEIIAEVEELSELRDKLIEETRDLHCM